MNLHDILDRDNEYLFDVNDISEDVRISTNSQNERTVKGSLQADEVAFTATSGSALNAYNFKLYILDQPDMNLSKNCVFYVNRKAYRITDSRLEMGIRELSLEAK